MLGTDDMHIQPGIGELRYEHGQWPVVNLGHRGCHGLLNDPIHLTLGVISICRRGRLKLRSIWS